MSETAAEGEAVQRLLRAVPTLADSARPAGDGIDAAERVRQLTALEQLKSAAAALQATITNALLADELDTAAAAGRRETEAYRSVGGQLALARHESQARGRRLLGLARTLCTDLPCTLAALHAGHTNERRVEMIVAACGFLTPEQRRTLDAELAPHLASMGDAQTEASAHAIAYRLDPHGFTDRCRQAAQDRRITLRPAPDTMAYLTALLPVATAVACYAALTHHADTTIAVGDPNRPHTTTDTDTDEAAAPRSRDQVMADELLNRLTRGAITGVNDHGLPIRGQQPATKPADTGPARPTTSGRRVAGRSDRATNPADTNTDARDNDADADGVAGNNNDADADAVAGRDNDDAAPSDTIPTSEAAADHRAEPTGQNHPTSPGEVITEIELIITDRTLFDLADEPAHLVGYGPIPAPLARDLLLTGTQNTKAFFRRLYQHPHTGELLTMDSRRRTFPPGIKKFLRLRDRHCRMPWCGAPIRHADHIHPAAAGGPTTLTNAQGLCAHCNYLVSLYGWTTVATSGGTITTTTPTGTTYNSPPRRVGTAGRPQRAEPIEEPIAGSKQ